MFFKTNLTNNTPTTTLNKLRHRFDNTFTTANRYFPFRKKSTVSILKVENVLNPPIIPVVRNNLVFGEKTLLMRLISTIKPTSKLAIILENSVPYGKFA